ncbi:MAG: TldD/PmbA family protein [Acidimicrobiales bacterium]
MGPDAVATMIPPDLAQRVLDVAMGSGADFAEVFAEARQSCSARLDDRRVESVTTGSDRGVGIRVVRGQATGFAHTTDLSEDGLLAGARAAAAASVQRQNPAGPLGDQVAFDSGQSGSSSGPGQASPPYRVGGPYRRADGGDSEDPIAVEGSPRPLSKSALAELLSRADDAARTHSGLVRQVTASYGSSTRDIVVANSHGLYATDSQVRTRFFVQCVAADSRGRQTGYEAPGRTLGAEIFDQIAADEVARTAARRAVDMLDARPAPSGTLPVILHRGAGGVLFHEACGHGLEADLVERDASIFRGRLDEQVASPMVTLVDDGSYHEEWGTATLDDEGAPVARNTLIDQGRLADYMWDGLRARRSGRATSTNGRRQSYRHLPMVRMTNTYVLPGSADPAEIIAQTERGLYCVQLGGGQVNTATGDFVFGITEAYMVEDGQVTYPVRAANLIGNGPAVLSAIDAVGSDFATWTGTCGKNGQSVPVSAGQPTLRVSAMTVGGTGGA